MEHCCSQPKIIKSGIPYVFKNEPTFSLAKCNCLMNSIQNRALFTFVQYAEILSTTWLAARVISKYFWQFAYSFFSLRYEIFMKGGRVKPSARSSSLFIEFEFLAVRFELASSPNFARVFRVLAWEYEFFRFFWARV